MQLAKDKFCEKCEGKMKKIREEWRQAKSGPISGCEITVYACENCGHEHETSYSRD